MRSSVAAIGTVAFAATVPATVIGVLPRWLAQGREPPPARPAQRHLGSDLCAAGLPASPGRRRDITHQGHEPGAQGADAIRRNRPPACVDRMFSAWRTIERTGFG